MNSNGTPDYDELERPPFMRNKEARETSRSGKTAINTDTDTDLDYLDVPAFLRRQAD